MGEGSIAAGLPLTDVPAYVFWLFALAGFGTFLWCGIRTWSGTSRWIFLTSCALTWILGAAQDVVSDQHFGTADWGAVGLLLLGFVIVSGGHLDRVLSRPGESVRRGPWRRQLLALLVGFALVIPYFLAFSDSII